MTSLTDLAEAYDAASLRYDRAANSSIEDRMHCRQLKDAAYTALLMAQRAAGVAS